MKESDTNNIEFVFSKHAINHPDVYKPRSMTQALKQLKILHMLDLRGNRRLQWLWFTATGFT